MPDQTQPPDHHGVETVPSGEYANETMRLLLERSSCRSFYDKPIPDEIMNQVLEAGTHAPTGGNLQPYSIIKVENLTVKKRLAELCGNQPFIETAPVDLIFCLDWYRLRRWAELEMAPYAAHDSFRHFWIGFQDAIIAAQNICTAADSLGLGSCYVGTIIECLPQVREMFELPDGVFPLVLLSLGYPKERPAVKHKHAIDIITHNEKYRKMSDEEILEVYNTKYPYEGVDVTDERLAELERVGTRVHGEEWARKCLEHTRKNGKVRVAQRYFGLHYTADLMADDNDKFMRTMEDFGFGWFKKWTPHGE